MDSLQHICEKYLSIHPVRDIDLESLFPASIDYYSCLKQQQDVLHCTVLSATALKYPPHQPYTKSFLRAILNQLEKNGHEVDGELYLAYTNLLQNSSSHDGVGSEYSYRTYTLRDDTQVTLKETTNLIAEGTTGLRTWQASHVLLDHLLDRPSIIDGRRVLELGAGLGLLGIGLSSSRCPPSHYTLTDLHPTVLDTLVHNVSINLLGGGRTVPEAASRARVADEVGDEAVAKPSKAAVTVDVEKLDWEDEDQLELWTRMTPYDLILAADVVFDPSLYRPLLRTISTCLNVSLPSRDLVSITKSSSAVANNAGAVGRTPSRGERPVAILAATVRNEEALDSFLSLLGAFCLSVTEEVEKIYQLSPSQPEHRVRILHIEATGLLS